MDRYAISALEVVRLRRPQYYPPAVLAILAADPQTTDDIDAAIQPYLDATTRVPVLPEYSEAIRQARSAMKAYPFGIPPPTASFHGRLITLDNDGGIAFDPFRDDVHLSAVLSLIEEEDRQNV
ncbi:MAG TPA: hypothetical protein VHX14_20760 [Thermoanaerobaculia bacterium]|jgi:hypothetical protein|nr:hypothetical protein [Thermoanaerobaculia bacterium]